MKKYTVRLSIEGESFDWHEFKDLRSSVIAYNGLLHQYQYKFWELQCCIYIQLLETGKYHVNSLLHTEIVH